MSEPMAHDKLFGKYNEFVLILLGFILTGVAGTYIAQSYTTKNAELSAANKIFSEYSKLTGDRYFTMNQLALALRKSETKESRYKLWDAYRLELQKWNTARGYNREMIKLYFGQPIWNKERDIHYFFRAWGQSLEAENNKKNTIDFDCLTKKRDELLIMIHTFNFLIGAAIQAGEIGGNKPKSSVKKNERLKTLCLIKISSVTKN